MKWIDVEFGKKWLLDNTIIQISFEKKLRKPTKDLSFGIPFASYVSNLSKYSDASANE